MANKYSIPDEKIKVIHCGIDTETFRRKGNRPKFKDKSLSILNVGRLVPEKGQDILIQALSIVLERGLSFNLKIVGDGPQEKKLTDLVKSCGIEDKVIFMGAQTQENILEMLEEADVFILPSRSEGLPVVCMEAMAMEVFLIASRISGIPELVSDKINGLLIDPDDVDGLADAILWVNQNREELMKMTKTARKKIEKNFNRVNCTKELLAAMNI